jgi:hypothetical protein
MQIVHNPVSRQNQILHFAAIPLRTKVYGGVATALLTVGSCMNQFPEPRSSTPPATKTDTFVQGVNQAIKDREEAVNRRGVTQEQIAAANQKYEETITTVNKESGIAQWSDEQIRSTRKNILMGRAGLGAAAVATLLGIISFIRSRKEES